MENELLLSMEKTILSSYIFDYELAFNSSLKSEDFYFYNNQAIFKAIKELINEDMPIDEAFIIKKIGLNKQEYLLDILSSNAITNVDKYENDIKEECKKRNIIKSLNILKSKTDLTSEELRIETEKIFNYNQNNTFIKIYNTSNIQAKKPEFFLEDFIPIQKNEISLFTSSGGAGKSFTLLKILLELSKRNFKVIGWFSEDSLSITKNRIEILRKADNTIIKDIDIIGKEERLKPFIEYDKNRNLKISDFFYVFKKAMKNYDIICIDPLIAINGEDENSNSHARFLMNILNEWIEKENKTLLLIHHHSKGENSTARGASAFIDAVRLHYEVVKKENNNQDRFLILKKSNHFYGRNEFKIKLFDIPIYFEKQKNEDNPKSLKSKSVMDLL